MALLNSLSDVRRVLETARTIAVLGAHDDLMKPAAYVPDYMHRKGYRVLPVNPTKVGLRLWGEPVRATLAELAAVDGVGPIDVVDVFRRSGDLPGHLDDILAMRPLPKVVWLQLGIRNAAVTEKLVAAGIDVIDDRCMLADHRMFGLPPIARGTAS